MPSLSPAPRPQIATLQSEVKALDKAVAALRFAEYAGAGMDMILRVEVPIAYWNLSLKSRSAFALFAGDRGITIWETGLSAGDCKCEESPDWGQTPPEVADATEQRKEEHGEFLTFQTENNAAVQLIEKAKNRLSLLFVMDPGEGIHRGMVAPCL